MTLREAVLSAIEQAGVWGVISEEVERQLGRSHQSVGPRIRELRLQGKIVASGRRRKTSSGTNAMVWVLGDGREVRAVMPAMSRTEARRTLSRYLGMIEEDAGNLNADSYQGLFQLRLGLVGTLVKLGYVEPLTFVAWLGARGWKFGPPTKDQGALFDSAVETALQVLGRERFDEVVDRVRLKDEKGWWAGYSLLGGKDER